MNRLWEAGHFKLVITPGSLVITPGSSKIWWQVVVTYLDEHRNTWGLVGGLNHLEKHESHWERLSHIPYIMEKKFETTNQRGFYMRYGEYQWVVHHSATGMLIQMHELRRNHWYNHRGDVRIMWFATTKCKNILSHLLLASFTDMKTRINMQQWRVRTPQLQCVCVR